MGATLRIRRYWPQSVTGAVPQRAAAVDALRGLMILGMVLYFAQPYEVLPAWMYHAQEPPPTHVPDFGIAGLTWPDIVFPIFVFTLGVAIPLALAPRLDRGERWTRLAGGAVLRGALLMFFAVFRQHVDSATTLAAPSREALIGSLAGFVVLCGIFVRLPTDWPQRLRAAVRTAAWGAAVAMLAFLPSVEGEPFTPWRIDVVIAVLAYCALFGTLVWLVSREQLVARLGIFGLIVLFRLAEGRVAWVQAIYDLPAPSWLYNAAFLHYLCIAIPGTIAGDLIYRAMRQSRPTTIAGTEWQGWRSAATVSLLIGFVPLLVVGITARQIWATGAAAAGVCGAAIWLTWPDGGRPATVLARLVRWGTLWLLAGIALDPFEGGTHKLPPTFAWFFINAGLGTMLLAPLLIVCSVSARALRLLTDVGQNPMLAYVAYGMLALPLLGLSGIKLAIESIEPGRWGLFGWGVAVTLAIAILVQWMTRRRLVWRT